MSELTEKLKKLGWGPSKLAAALGIRSQAVSQWSEVPPKRVPMVHHLTGVPAKDLNPAFNVEDAA
jgi:DNA-binding transcriptional regulator YdaS (Cro superfamily)